MSDMNINEDAQSGGEFSGSSLNDGSGSQPIESAFPDEDEDTITMLDVIEREDKLEEEASAVLGNSDEKNCTYPKGYISRQALYSCATCSEGSDKLAAICLACSLECHDNHEVYELYTKRNYRCDCGNSKFKPDFECKLMDKHQKKLSLNENNKYNHNFTGRYCICDKRYPPDETDDSAESNDEMWQCIVCEDWYHTKHLGAKELPTKFDEMMCGQCVTKLDFIRYYKDCDKFDDPIISQNVTNSREDDKPAIDNNEPEVEPNDQDGSESDLLRHEKLDLPGDIKKNSESTTSRAAICESDTNDSQAENKAPKIDQIGAFATISMECKLDKLIGNSSKQDLAELSDKKTGSSSIIEPIFWSDCAWRACLCRCQKCLDMYKEKNCEYLLDEKDTVHYYEAQGKAIAKNTQTPLERGMSALNRMNRAAVVEALHGYDELKADLSVYLKKFAESKKVVREEDIREFFDQLKSKKRPRLEYE